MRHRSSVEIRDDCPYCGYRFSIDARDIEGELHALRCLDCKEKFVVEIVVSVSHLIDGIAGLKPDDVLDRLGVDLVEDDPVLGTATPIERTCIGCGCIDSRACWDEVAGQPCHWFRVDTDAGVGVCSECEGHVGRFDAGSRSSHHSIEERPDDAEDGIPVLTDVIHPPGSRELPDAEFVDDDDESESADVCTQVTVIDDQGPAEITDAELAELQQLLGEKLDDDDAEASAETEHVEFAEEDDFENCRQCNHPVMCQARGVCDRKKPARAKSGITQRPPLTMSSIGGTGVALGPGVKVKHRR